MWRLCSVFVLVLACGSSKPDKHEPTTAKEKQLQEARESGDLDKPTTKWGGWRYTGTRSDCFYVIGRRCFKSRTDACNTCKRGTTCEVVGGGPATVTCKKPEKP